MLNSATQLLTVLSQCACCPHQYRQRQLAALQNVSFPRDFLLSIQSQPLRPFVPPSSHVIFSHIIAHIYRFPFVSPPITSLSGPFPQPGLSQSFNVKTSPLPPSPFSISPHLQCSLQPWGEPDCLSNLSYSQLHVLSSLSIVTCAAFLVPKPSLWKWGL